MTDELQAQDATTTEPAEAIEVQDTEPAADTGAANSVDELPDWAQNLLKELRAENAKHRKAKTAAEKAAEEAARKQAEEQGEYKRLYEDALQKAQQAEQKAQAAELARLKASIATKHSLPAPLVDRLRGETEEELEADALALLEAIPKPQPATRTDGAAGVNGKQPTPQKSEAEIRELAARLGVSYEHLRKQFIKE